MPEGQESAGLSLGTEVLVGAIFLTLLLRSSLEMADTISDILRLPY